MSEESSDWLEARYCQIWDIYMLSVQDAVTDQWT